MPISNTFSSSFRWYEWRQLCVKFIIETDRRYTTCEGHLMAIVKIWSVRVERNDTGSGTQYANRGGIDYSLFHLCIHLHSLPRSVVSCPGLFGSVVCLVVVFPVRQIIPVASHSFAIGGEPETAMKPEGDCTWVSWRERARISTAPTRTTVNLRLGTLFHPKISYRFLRRCWICGEKSFAKNFAIFVCKMCTFVSSSGVARLTNCFCLRLEIGIVCAFKLALSRLKSVCFIKCSDLRLSCVVHYLFVFQKYVCNSMPFSDIFTDCVCKWQNGIILEF